MAVAGADMLGAYGNGANLHSFAGGTPTGRTDPSGLFFGLGFQLATMAVDSWQTADGTLAEAQQGMLTVFGLGLLISDAQYLQMMDVDWALDWSQDDNYLLYGTGYPGTPGADDGSEAEEADGPVMAGDKFKNKKKSLKAKKADLEKKQKQSGAGKRADATRNAADKPTLTHNPKHHQNSNGPEPKDAGDAYRNAVTGPGGNWWASNGRGDLNRYSKPSSGETHWNGSVNSGDKIPLQNIPNDIRTPFEL